jgi:peptide/nickel transport system permease protein
MGGVRSVLHVPVSSDCGTAGTIRFGAVTCRNVASGSSCRIVARFGVPSYLGSHMARIVLKRLAQGVFIVWLTTTITFFLVHAAPGEPFADMLTDPRATAAMREASRARYGLDRPVAEQYVRYVRSVATGDFGQSITDQRPVLVVLANVLPRTLLLMGTALLIGFAAGIALGTLQGARAGGWFDRLTGSIAVLVTALPDFLLALLAVMLFAGTWLPISGFSTPTLSPTASPIVRALDVLRHLVLPAGTLALLISALVSRYQRAALIDVLPSVWLRTARAKGLARRPVVFRHALRNALLPIITLGGLAMPALLGGAVFVEVTFSWQGMGSLAVQAVADRDYPVILAAVILSSVLVVLGAALADLAHAAADPRQRRA